MLVDSLWLDGVVLFCWRSQFRDTTPYARRHIFDSSVRGAARCALAAVGGCARFSVCLYRHRIGFLWRCLAKALVVVILSSSDNLVGFPSPLSRGSYCDSPMLGANRTERSILLCRKFACEFSVLKIGSEVRTPREKRCFVLARYRNTRGTWLDVMDGSVQNFADVVIFPAEAFVRRDTMG